MNPANEGPRDWDKELAQIDKLIAEGKTDAPPLKDAQARRRAGAQQDAGASSPQRVSAAEGGRLAALRHTPFFTWVRLLLALGLGIGMTQWPYTHGCGVPLYGYLAGVATVIIASLWTMVSSWKSRSGFAHFLSVALLFWGAALAAREVLPRIGYARQGASWSCARAPVQVAPSPTPTPAHP